MDKSERAQNEAVIRNLKILLMHLAIRCEKPELQLQELLREVLRELHDGLETQLQARLHAKEEAPVRHLKVVKRVPSAAGSDMTGA